MVTQHCLYTIRIKGRLGATALSAFPTMVSELKDGETVLTGVLETARLCSACLDRSNRSASRWSNSGTSPPNQPQAQEVLGEHRKARAGRSARDHGLPLRVAAFVMSPYAFADLSGLPPLMIQAGTHEVLLDDAVRPARQAAIADVEVILDVTAKVPHVFQALYPVLDEAATALDRAGQFLSARLCAEELVAG